MNDILLEASIILSMSLKCTIDSEHKCSTNVLINEPVRLQPFRIMYSYPKVSFKCYLLLLSAKC